MAGRAAAAVDGELEAGVLKLAVTGGGDCVLTAVGGNLKVNGSDPLLGGVPSVVSAAAFSELQLNGDESANVIDAAAVVAAAGFANLESITIDSDGGNDTLVGSAEFGTAFFTGEGDDIVTGGAGDDRYEWHDGDGADTVALGAGVNGVELHFEVPGEANTLELSAVGNVLHVDSTLPTADTLVEATGVSSILVALGSGDDALTIGAIATAVDGTSFLVEPGPGIDTVDAPTCDRSVQLMAVYGEGNDAFVGGTATDVLNIAPDPALAMNIAYTAAGTLLLQTESTNSTTVRFCANVEQVRQVCAPLGSTTTVADLAGTPVEAMAFTLGSGFDSLDASAAAVEIAASRFPGSLLDIVKAGSSADDTLIVFQGNASTPTTSQFGSSGSQLVIIGTEPGGPWEVTAEGFEQADVRTIQNGTNSVTFGDVASTSLLRARAIFGSQDDVCSILASPTVEYHVSGGAHLTGDILNIDVAGRPFVAPDDMEIVDVDGCQVIGWNTVETVNFINAPSGVSTWALY